MFIKVLRGTFYVEVVVNFSLACLALLFPLQFISLFTKSSGGIVSELLRWYGVAIVVFAYVELRALLRKHNEILAVVLEGFLVGDILQVIVVFQFANANAGWNVNMVAILVLTIILAALRITWLRIYK